MTRVIHFLKNRYVLLFLLLAAVLRVLYVVSLEERYYYFDTAHYDSAACSILENGTFGKSLHYYDDYEHYCLEPVYPIFLAGIYNVFGHSFLAVRLVQVLLSVLHLWIIFLIVRLLRPAAAKWALVFGAVYPFFIYISGLLYVTQLFALFLSLTIFFFLKYSRRYAIHWLALSALFLGLAIAARPVAMPMVLFLALWILFFARIDFRQKIGHALLASFCIMLVLTPWTIRNWNVYHILSPGRTCLAETRVFETLDLEYRIEDSKKMTTFPVREFSVQVTGDTDSPIFTCYADGEIIAKLEVNESFERLDTAYVGLLAKGGSAMTIGHLRFAQDDDIVLSSQNAIVGEKSPEISFDSSGILIQPSEISWRYAATFSPALKTNRFYMSYPESIKPGDVSRIAILFNLDRPSLDANGYMIWLHPWMQADLWRIEKGRPMRSVNTIDLFLKEHPVDVKELVMKDPMRFLTKHVIPEFLNFWSPGIKRITTSSNVGRAMNAMSLLFFTPLLILFLVGTIAFAKEWQLLLVLYIPIATISGVYSIFFTELRYRIPIDAFLIILAAIGWHWLLHVLKKRRLRV